MEDVLRADLETLVQIGSSLLSPKPRVDEDSFVAYANPSCAVANTNIRLIQSRSAFFGCDEAFNCINNHFRKAPMDGGNRWMKWIKQNPLAVFKEALWRSCQILFFNLLVQ